MFDPAHTLLLATRNAGKIRELSEALTACGLTVVGLDAFPDLPDVEENGASFEENALIKARFAAQATGLVSVADDSGLEVDALGGRPGIYSARYGNDMPFLDGETRDMRNNRKLLQELDTIPDARRTARFVCVMAACTPDGRHLSVRGTWEGRILRAPQGENGFGYDPLFYDEQIACSAACLRREEKTARSHRGNALRKLLAAWPEFWKIATGSQGTARQEVLQEDWL